MKSRSNPACSKRSATSTKKCPSSPVVAAGSLLEFSLADHAFPMPVGRITYFHMGPVTFEEFLGALEESQLLELLATYQIGQPFPAAAHNRLLSRLREYLLVGGMPEAVQLFADGETFPTVFEAQRSILQTYRDDFSKYATGNALVRLQRILDYLGQGTGKKVKYANIDRQSQARETRAALDLIEKAGVVLRATHTHADGVPLAAQADPKTLKLFCLDIGLLNRITRLDHIPETALKDTKFINQGTLAEQFIAQHLHFQDTPALPPSLHYWLREGRANNAEVDFLIQANSNILPIEVKSGATGTLRSLHQFGKTKRPPLLIRFDLNPPALTPPTSDSSALLSLPPYFCTQIERLAKKQIP